MARPKKCGKCSKPKRPKGKKYKNLEGYCECGRETVMDERTLHKLEDAFSFGMSDENACAYAEIGTTTLYNYQKKNPKFVERKAMLKRKPNLIAQETIVNSLKDPNHAWKWMERKDPEFKPKTEVKHTGAVEMIETEEEMSEEEKQAVELLRMARKKRLENKTKSM